MVGIRKVYFLLIFIGTCFSFADSTSYDYYEKYDDYENYDEVFDEVFESTIDFADSPTALSYCIPCSEEYKDQTCDDWSNEAHTDLAPISIRDGGTDVSCIPCNNEFPNLDLSIICSELDEQVEMEQVQIHQAIPFPDHIFVDTRCESNDNEVYHEGQCQTLLGQSNCAEGHWLTRRNKVLTCEVRPCPIGKIEFKKTCSEPFRLCRKDYQKLEIYSDGTAECSCEDYYVKDPSTGECLGKHSQGPCKVGWMIDKLVDSSPVCIPDICHDLIDVHSVIYDRLVNRMVCAKNNYDGYCEPWMRSQNRITTVVCNYGLSHGVSGTTSLRIEECRRNQKRGYDGTCNKQFIFKTRP